MKGLLLAGGMGSRLQPLTLAVNKHLLPVYDKPMIYYPLSVLMLGGIRDIGLVCNPDDEILFRRLFGDGSRLGLKITYLKQSAPRGIPDALLLARDWLNGESVCMVLGDNIFFGESFGAKLAHAIEHLQGACVFTQQVKQPERFGVAVFDGQQHIVALQEKPSVPCSDHAVTGLYLFDGQAAEIAATLTPSARGELEIIDVLEAYRLTGRLQHTPLGRGFTWLDAGTPQSLLEAGMCVQTIENMQGHKIACLEELAIHQGWCCAKDFDDLPHSGYNDYVKTLTESDSCA